MENYSKMRRVKEDQQYYRKKCLIPRYIAKGKKAWLGNRSENRGGSEYIVKKWVQEEMEGESLLQAQWGENLSSNILFPDDFITTPYALPSSANLIIKKKKNTLPERKQTCYYLFLREGPLDTIDSSTSPN